MEWRFHRFKSLDDPALQEWQQLNIRIAGTHPGLDGQYMGLLLQYFGSEDDLIAIAKDQGMTIAAAIITPIGKWRWSLFLPGQGCLAPLLLDPTYSAERLLHSMMKSLPGTCLMLRIPRLDPLYQPVLSESGNRRLDSSVYGETYRVDLGQDFSAYWQQRSKRLRQTVRKKLRDAVDAGHDVQIKIGSDVRSVRRGVQIHADIESKGWKGRAGSAIDFRGPQGPFYSDLLESFATRQSAIAVQLYLDAIPIASLLLIGAGTMVIELKTAYDEDFRPLSPGRVIEYLFLEESMPNLRQPDFEAYTRAKKDDLTWASHSRTIYDVDMYRTIWLRALRVSFEKLCAVIASINPVQSQNEPDRQ